MAEELKTLTESSSNSTCACFEKSSNHVRNLQWAEMKVECSMQSNHWVCNRAKSSMRDDQKGTKNLVFGLMFVPCFQSPWNYRKKGRLILCNFTFMFSLSCYIICWFVLVDILISMAEITFNCSVEKMVLETACESNPCCVAKLNINFSKRRLCSGIIWNQCKWCKDVILPFFDKA